MNADNINFRPHQLGDLLSGVAKGWSVEDSLTCKRRLLKIYREVIFNRYYSFSNKYTEKGIKMEQDGITLYSRFRKKLYKKNELRLSNAYFNGECDIDDSKDTEETIDIKCSWDLNTFPHTAVDKIDADYRSQGVAYMDLYGSKRHIIAYCLVNAPANLITREKEKVYYNLGCPDDDDLGFQEAKREIERNMIFDMEQFKKDNPHFDIDSTDWDCDIPIDQRVVEFSFDYNESELKKITDRIKDCREWMNTHLFKSEPKILLS